MGESRLSCGWCFGSPGVGQSGRGGRQPEAGQVLHKAGEQEGEGSRRGAGLGQAAGMRSVNRVSSFEEATLILPPCEADETFVGVMSRSALSRVSSRWVIIVDFERPPGNGGPSFDGAAQRGYRDD